MAYSRSVTLSISSFCNLDIEANKFYDRAHRVQQFMKEMLKNLFWSIKYSGEILNKLKLRTYATKYFPC